MTVAGSSIADMRRKFRDGLAVREEIDGLVVKIQHDYERLRELETPPPELVAAVESFARFSQGTEGYPEPNPELEAFNDASLALSNSTSIEKDIGAWHRELVDIRRLIRTSGNLCYRLLQKHDLETSLTDKSPEQLLGRKGMQVIKHLNQLNANMELILKRQRPACYPRFLIVDPTNACNFRCRTCFQSESQEFYHSNIRPSTIEDLLPILPYVTELKLYGTGEPMLSKDLANIAHHGIRYYCETDTLTNGAILTKRDIPLDRFDRVGISVDGATARTFEAIRVGTGFNDLCKNIREFRKRAPNTLIYLNVTVNRANLDELAAMAILAADLEVDGIQFNQMLDYMERLKPLALQLSDSTLLESELDRVKAICAENDIFFRNDVYIDSDAEDGSPLDKEALLRDLEATEVAGALRGKLSSKEAEDLQVLPFHRVPDFIQPPERDATPRLPSEEKVVAPNSAESKLQHTRLWMTFRKLKPKNIELPHCTAPWMRMYVESDSRIRPCCVFDGYVGDLARQSFMEIWHGSAYTKLRAAMYDTDNLPANCRTCRSSERYHYLEQTLTLVREQGIDIRSLRPPENWAPPEEIWELMRAPPLRKKSAIFSFSWSPKNLLAHLINGAYRIYDGFRKKPKIRPFDSDEL